jgi:uncharacterized membrane protein
MCTSGERANDMRPIWYFVGLFLLITGALVLGAGIYDFVNPSAEHTVLENLHPGLWWGAFMVLAGLLFLLLNRKKVVE